MRRKLVDAVDLSGVRIWLWRDGQYLYLGVKYGEKRRVIYLGRAEDRGGGAVGPRGLDPDCWDLLQQVVEEYRGAVEVVKKALREAKTKEEMREALDYISTTALRRAEEALRARGGEAPSRGGRPGAEQPEAPEPFSDNLWVKMLRSRRP